MARKLKKAGCYLVSLGIESSNDKTLKYYNKSYTLEQINKAIRLLQKAKIEIHGYFILGSPSDSKKEMLETIDYAIKSKINFATFSVLTPFPGTQLYDMVLTEGVWKDSNKLNYESQIGTSTPQIDHPEVSKEEIEKMQKMAYHKFYFRWQTIPNALRLAVSNPLYPYSVLRCQLS